MKLLCYLRKWYLRKSWPFFEYRRDRHIGIYIWSAFSQVAGGIAVAGWSGGVIGENVATRGCVLELWLMTERSGMSARSDINNVKISDLLAFVVMLLFSLFVLTWTLLVVEVYTSLRIMKTFIGEGGDSFTTTLKNHWHFYFTCQFAKRYSNNYFPMKLLLQKSVKKPSIRASKVKTSN